MRVGRWGASLAGVVLLGGAMLIRTDRQTAGQSHFSAVASSAVPRATAQARVAASFGKRPLSFEANQGQTDPRVKFMARGSGYSLFLTGNEAVLKLTSSRGSGPTVPIRGVGFIGIGSSHHDGQSRHESAVRLTLAGANPSAVEGAQKLVAESSYYIGNDPRRWRTHVPHYARVNYQDVYPGVDLVYYGNQNQLEHDFTVAPGADANAIRIAVSGARPSLTGDGNVTLEAADGKVILEKPLIYQTGATGRELVAGNYTLVGNTLGFALGTYDHTQPLVIDPVLLYSTYLGGSAIDIGESIALDSAGNIIVVGPTESPDFPVTSGSLTGMEDGFITKLDPTGQTELLSVYLGGSAVDATIAIALDSSDNMFVTGLTESSDFPVTSGAFQTTFSGGGDAFVSKFDSAGTMLYSTYFGGDHETSSFGIALDSAGEAYITGETNARNLPRMNAFQHAYGGGLDAFAAKFNSSGSALVFSTYMGGAGADRAFYIVTDSAGNAYYTGMTNSPNFPTTPGVVQQFPSRNIDAWAVKLSPAGGQTWGTYLGGFGHDVGIGVAVNAASDVYLTGYTRSNNFPTTASAFQPAFGGGVDAYLTELSPNATSFVFSTFLGSANYDSGEFVVVDSAGDPYVVGNTRSPNFPTMNPFQSTFAGGASLGDAFIAEFDPTGSSLIYSTYLGGTQDDVAYGVVLDSSGNAFVTGETDSTDFPTVSPFQSAQSGLGDSMIAKISPGTPGKPR